MRVKILVTAALAASVISSLPAFGQDGGSGIYREALNLYSSGMYERARTLFESLPGNDMAEGYAVLCALKLNSVDAADVYSDYASRHGRATLLPQMHYERALTLFDAQDYPGAASEFAKVDAKAVSAMNSAEALFKRGYCAFAAGDHATARSFFGKVDSMPMSAFTSLAAHTMPSMPTSGLATLLSCCPSHSATVGVPSIFRRISWNSVPLSCSPAARK